jgi:hypothetical protein
MKRIFLLIVLPALLVAMGSAQTPAASGNTDQINIKGCLGGSDGNYTVAEDNTGKIFKITTSADLKAYVGQDVKLTGSKAGGAENSLAVTEVNMISEHCTAAAAAPAATASAPAETGGTPPAAAAPAAAPTAAEPDATISSPPDTIIERPTPAAPASAEPTARVSTPPETIGTPPVAAAAPASTVSTPAQTASAPPAAAPVHRSRPSAERKPPATPAAAPAPAEPVSKPVADAAVPTAPVGTPAETASTPAAPATTASTSKSVGMLVSIVVVVLLIGTAVPLYNRWRKRKLLEQTRGQNLSFTKEAKSDPGKSGTTGGRKAA